MRVPLMERRRFGAKQIEDEKNCPLYSSIGGLFQYISESILEFYLVFIILPNIKIIGDLHGLHLHDLHHDLHERVFPVLVAFLQSSLGGEYRQSRVYSN